MRKELKLIIFGAGGCGKVALSYFGNNLVEYFADNYLAGQVIRGKRVLNLTELKEINSKEYLIVVASELYATEMKQQLLDIGIHNYFVFSKTDIIDMLWYMPGYWLYGRYIHPSYAEVISDVAIEDCSSIGIIFDNETIRYGHYFIIDIMIRNSSCTLQLYIDSDEYIDNAWGFSINRWEFNDVNCDLVMINVLQKNSKIRNYLSDGGKYFDLFDIDKRMDRFRHAELAKFKNIHKGKRCFIIGTGPSLSVEDLNKLHKNGEICITCNKTYRVYDKTPWRADYYGFLDGRVIEDCCNDLDQIPGEIFMGDSYHYENNKRISGVNYFHYIREAFYPEQPRFSFDITYGMYGGATTTYSFGLQLAAYMGFSEIYLLGVDNTVVGNCSESGNHFIKDYFRNGEESRYLTAVFRPEMVNQAYMAAEIISRKNGFRIFNATRGGALECFERVDFDNLFE